MKTILMLIVCCSLWGSVVGQTQEMEQLKLNIAKLAQLRLQLSQAKQGYQMLVRSYQQLHDVSKGNYEVHKQQLDALWQVSSLISQSPSVSLFKRLAASLDSLLQQWLIPLKSAKVFTNEERSVLEDRLAPYRKEIDALSQRQQLLLMPEKLQLREAERFSLLQQVTKQAFECLENAKKEIQQQQLIWVQRKQGARDRKMIQQLYRN